MFGLLKSAKVVLACLIIGLCLTACSHRIANRTEQPPTMQQVVDLVRNYAFSSNPDLHTNTQFRIHDLPVKGLWDELRIQVYNVDYVTSSGRPFSGFVGLYHDGKMIVLAPSFGGRGLMSGLVHSDTFYFTFSWGSGAYRSHVARLRFVDGKLKYADSGGFLDMELFVSRGTNGKIRVSSGKYIDFNGWEEGLGIVEEQNTPVVEIFSAHGGRTPFAPAFPAQEERDIDAAGK